MSIKCSRRWPFSVTERAIRRRFFELPSSAGRSHLREASNGGATRLSSREKIKQNMKRRREEEDKKRRMEERLLEGPPRPERLVQARRRVYPARGPVIHTRTGNTKKKRKGRRGQPGEGGIERNLQCIKRVVRCRAPALCSAIVRPERSCSLSLSLFLFASVSVSTRTVSNRWVHFLYFFSLNRQINKLANEKRTDISLQFENKRETSRERERKREADANLREQVQRSVRNHQVRE